MFKNLKLHKIFKESMPYLFSVVLVAALVLAFLGNTNAQAGTDNMETSVNFDAEKLALDQKYQEILAASNAFAAAQAEAEKRLQEEREALDQTAQELNSLITQAQDTITQAQDVLDKTGTAMGEVTDKMEELDEKLKEAQEKTEVKWILPINYVEFTRAFGYRTHPITGEVSSFHCGVDLAAYVGTPIVATRAGVVKAATYDGVAGYYVTIDHGDGMVSKYLHMKNYVVKTGQNVAAGQLIGYSGESGSATGPHLHFAIYKNGDPVDPAAYMKIR